MSRSGQGAWKSRHAALAHPLELGREAALEVRPRREAQFLARTSGVRPGITHVARLACAAADIERPPGERGERLQRAVEAHAVPTTEVVDAARVRPRLACRPRARDDVLDEGEVARLVPVAVDLDRRAGHDRLAEAPERHVGALS